MCFTKHENKVLKKMFSIIGLKYSPEFCRKKNWYLKHSWDKKQEEDFRKFYIKTARKDLKLTKIRAEEEFAWFNLMFGWTQKD